MYLCVRLWYIRVIVQSRRAVLAVWAVKGRRTDDTDGKVLEGG